MCPGDLPYQSCSARWAATKVLMAASDTAALSGLDKELSECMRDMQVTVEPDRFLESLACGLLVL